MIETVLKFEINTFDYIFKMIGELQKRPQSKHRTNLRPLTSRNVSEANRQQSDECFEMGKKHMAKE